MTVPPYRNWLIIVAMDVEEQAVLARSSNYQQVEISPKLKIQANASSVADRQILVAKSGVGLVNAALTTAFIADRRSVDIILLLGVAGALHGDLRVGDLVLADRVIQHDAVCSGPEGMELMAPGQLHVSIPKEQRPEPSLVPDEGVRQWLRDLLVGSKDHKRVFTGTLVSGNEFVASPVRKRALAEIDKHVLAVEMEAAGVAQTARKLGIPFVVAKTIADRLSPESAIADEYLLFMKRAAENAALIMDMLVSKWTHG
jgi:adenosylhomocysteine nucleosidase